MIPIYNSSHCRNEVEKHKGNVRCDSIVFHCFFIVPFILFFVFGTWSSWFWYIVIFFPYALIGQYGWCASNWNSSISTVSTYVAMLNSTRIICSLLMIGTGLGFIASWVWFGGLDCYRNDDCEDNEDLAEALMILSGIIFVIVAGTFTLAQFAYNHAKKLQSAMEEANQTLNDPLIVAGQPQVVYPQPQPVIFGQFAQNGYQNIPRMVPPSYPVVQPVGYPNAPVYQNPQYL
ncbi:unnamed protein product [Blepharisma stoltei]|uniref:Uncharacterized protein n=1 Tax=Blepharisma stoltei TaxID=1481888 RepID=A0AAU9K1F7_9CILI|nr:unnamed protein product [Blepharisma stoltei]